jgi:hypothetical protein
MVATNDVKGRGGGPYSGSRVAGFGGHIGTTAAVPILSLFPGILWFLIPVTGLPTVNSTRHTQVHTVRAYLAELTIMAQKPGCGGQYGCPVYCHIYLYSGSTLLWIWESVTFCHTWHESGKSGVRIKKALRIVAYRYTMKTKDI